MIDLGAYFDRIGYRGPAAASLDVLNGIVHAHTVTIPFENLDVLLGRGIGLEPEALQKKLVADRRGGYCFEHNGLLLLVLEAIGFDAVPLSARVRYQRPRDYTPARTHLFLRVTIDGRPWLADVGFGSLSPTSAFRLDVEGEEQQTPHEPRRIIRQENKFFHQVRFGDEWHDASEFTGEEMPFVDRELANWFTSTHPQSLFRNRLIAARALPDGGRVTLVNRELSIRDRSGHADMRMVATPVELVEVLRQHFGLHFPADTIFPCAALDWPVAEAAAGTGTGPALDAR